MIGIYLEQIVLELRRDVSSATPNLRERARDAEERIFGHFQTRIGSGQLQPGDRLPSERSIAATFAANRKTVRQALQRLGDAGVIERRQGSGSYVLRPITPLRPADDVDTPAASPLDALEARQVFEVGLYPLVVARATGDDFERMREAIDSMRKAEDQIAFKKAGYQFHLQVARATRNPVLIGMYELLIAARAKAGWGKLLELNDRQELRDDQLAGLRDIYDALASRDATRAAELARTNMIKMLSHAVASPRDI